MAFLDWEMDEAICDEGGVDGTGCGYTFDTGGGPTSSGDGPYIEFSHEKHICPKCVTNEDFSEDEPSDRRRAAKFICERDKSLKRLGKKVMGSLYTIMLRDTPVYYGWTSTTVGERFKNHLKKKSTTPLGTLMSFVSSAPTIWKVVFIKRGFADDEMSLITGRAFKECLVNGNGSKRREGHQRLYSGKVLKLMTDERLFFLRLSNDGRAIGFVFDKEGHVVSRSGCFRTTFRVRAALEWAILSLEGRGAEWMPVWKERLLLDVDLDFVESRVVGFVGGSGGLSGL